VADHARARGHFCGVGKSRLQTDPLFDYGRKGRIEVAFRARVQDNKLLTYSARSRRILRCSKSSAIENAADQNCSRRVRLSMTRSGSGVRCYSITSSARCWSCKGTSRPSALAVLARLRCGHPSSECPQKCEVSAPADYWPSRALIAASVQGFLLHDDWDDGW
jgi:hypothetical protein